MTNVLLTIAIIVGVLLLVTISVIEAKIRRFSGAWFGTPDLMNGIEMQKEIYDATPKSVSSLTKLDLPRIQADFPEFNWHEWRQLCETQIKAYLTARSSRNLALAGNPGKVLKDQIRREIESDFGDDLIESFEEVIIHDTEISRYEKKPGMCRIKVETALQYYHSISDHGIMKLSRQLEQHIFVSELVYVQDMNLVGSEFATAVTANCPNCGAPVKILGMRTCPYCSSGIEPLNIRVWQLHRISIKN